MSETPLAVRPEAQKATSLGDPNTLPPIGAWFWVKVEADDSDCNGYTFSGNMGLQFHKTTKRRQKKKKAERYVEKLMCVEHIASNHVRFCAYEGDSGETMQVTFQELLTDCRPAPEWRKVLDDRMEQVRLEIQLQTRLLYEEGQKANALPPTNTTFAPQGEVNPLSLALRTVDPAIQKRDLLALQKKIPVVTKAIGELAEMQAGLAKMIMLPEMSYMEAMKTKLEVVEDKIFTLEIYAGMQEQVLQIADGKPAMPNEKITVRQSLLFMDEETLFDYTTGGMDFRNLGQFDKWVVQPKHLNRCLPEPKGVVAFRVRREKKNYGKAETLAAAWVHAEWNLQNMETYLLIRNGERVFRIASAVDFSPRLIPLRDEFEGAFMEKAPWYSDRDEPAKLIHPHHFGYDKKVAALQDRLKHYNRVVVLLQGLLDRTECYHPHPPINLAGEADIAEWLNLVRDEEGALESGSLVETWEQYRDRLNEWIQPGSCIYSAYQDLRRRPYDAKGRPPLVEVKKVRAGNKGDIIPELYGMGYGRGGGYGHAHYGRKAKECVGLQGVEIEWDGGECYRPYRNRQRSYNPLPTHYQYTGRMWIPITAVFNVSEYQLGDYKTFLCDRTQKGAYLKWAAPLLSAEDWHREKAGLLPPKKAKKKA